MGTLGLVLYGRGGRGLLVSGIWLYHVAAISLLAGPTRYRVPLEPLLMIYVAWFVTEWEVIGKCIDSEKRQCGSLRYIGGVLYDVFSLLLGYNGDIGKD